jgi:hypothetical protein
MATQNGNGDSYPSPSRSPTELKTPPNRRPTLPLGLGSAPGKIMNGDYAAEVAGGNPGKYEHGIQVIDGDKAFK